LSDANRPRFERQLPLDAYGDHAFKFGDRRFDGSVLITPRGIYRWDVESADKANAASLAQIVIAAGEIDFLIIGTGEAHKRLPKETLAALARSGLFPDQMQTGAACRTYNVLINEARRVAAALIAVA
jgi:uncharacterized protein